MDSRPPPPPPPGPSPGPSPGGQTPVGFGPGSSPLAQVQPRPLSRASTPGAHVVSPGEARGSGGRSPFAGQPAVFRASPSPGPGMSPRPAMGARVTSPLARSA
ncbi:hypothetical protein GGF43_005103, partial [Coemansia sp. RSA 2618]